MDKKEVISLYKSQNYIDNLKETLEGMKGLQIYEHIESFNSKYIRRILYKDDESKQGKITKRYRFNGFSVGTSIYIATTTVGTKNDKTTQDILDRIEKKKKKKKKKKERKRKEKEKMKKKIKKKMKMKKKKKKRKRKEKEKMKKKEKEKDENEDEEKKKKRKKRGERCLSIIFIWKKYVI